MRLYSLRSRKTLVCILYRLCLLQAAWLIPLRKRDVEGTSNNERLANKTFDGPVIVLMSSNTVALAQLPMILYGNLTEVYVLAEEHQHQDEDLSDIDDEERRTAEDDEDEMGGRNAYHGGGLDADAREFEQMPRKMSANTTTSLGKSEWQQIANGARDRGEVSSSDQAGKKVGRGEEAQEDDEQEDERHLGRRPRRSNSSNEQGDDSAIAGAGRSDFNGANEKESHTDVGDSQHAQESNKQNVTSAASSLKQPDLATAGDAPAEEDDKISRSSASFSNPRPGPPASSSPTTSSSGAAAPSGRVYFSDFDVHMALGYAFVADSAGRIHRFKLPVGWKSSAASRRASGLRYSNYNQKSTVPNGVAIVGDDSKNTIDASSNFPSPRSRVVDAVNGSESSSGAQPNSNGSVSDSDAANSHSTGGSDDANKAGERQSDDVTHEQTENESQHPTISGGQSDSLDSFHSDSLASGQARLNHERRNVGSKSNIELVDDVKPKIIWSRSKYARKPSSSGEAEREPYSAKQRARQQLANARGALPQSEINQATEARRTATELHHGARPNSEVTQTQFDARTDNEIHNDQSNLGAKFDRLRRVQSSTEIAVDWLNNLLFVLDKSRLLVMDFDGNNELILIDDFNANNRPVDIKLDPINDFLFWLQVGKFHNTIYKLDLSVLSMPSATQKLVSNTLRLRQSAQANASLNDNGLNFDSSDLVPLVSHHYAHPVITNLPRHARIFTIDHKHSRIYVPLSPSNAASNSPNVASSKESNLGPGAQSKRDDAEIFAASAEEVTHLNNTQSDAQFLIGADCSQNETQVFEGQILAYNLDGTDVGPFRTLGEKSHINSLDGIQDLTLNSEKGLLYWLVNDGRDLFEEFKEDSNFQPAQHYLFGRSYSKLMYFENNDANQPMSQKSRFNVRKIIHLLSSSITSNRQTRSGSDELDPAIIMGLRNSDMDSTRNAPYIILGVTCLVVVTVYLIYALIFQRIQSRPESRCHDSHGGVDSISGDSSMGTGSHIDDNLNGFVNSTTISRWVAGPSGRGTDTSTFDRDINSFNRRLGAYDIESTNYETSNAVDEHYRDSSLNNQTEGQFSIPSTSRLANLSEWPTNMLDLSNKLYVPVEVLQDEALSSIQRVSIDQLEIERTAPLGEGHFGTVLQGTIDCAKYNLESKRMISPCKAPISPDSLAPPTSARMFAPSTSSSGHGSSSSTSCEFATANTDCTNRDDYLTPRNQLSSTASDYGVDMPASTSQDESCNGYCETSAVRSFRTTPAALVGTKLKVAIKKLKDNASSEEKRDFLQEAKLLANFNHPNIVHLIGICLDRGSTLIIMELMLGGDLIRYMQENTPSLANNYADNLTYDDLLKICLDIANGCCYLEDMDYIHRDLAARNCLVSSRKREERVVKLADFGLARDIYKDSYYKKLNDSAMPLKWMAPECLIEQKFTKKSDVWSFGVVMWEVMSYCQEKPYSGVEPFFMKEHLASGARLRKPDCCDDNMYRLMNQCWQMEPDNRPTFHECRAMLIEIRNIGCL